MKDFMHQDALKVATLGQDFAIQQNQSSGYGSRGQMRSQGSPDFHPDGIAAEGGQHGRRYCLGGWPGNCKFPVAPDCTKAPGSLIWGLKRLFRSLNHWFKAS
jgi:hypothetical protein